MNILNKSWRRLAHAFAACNASSCLGRLLFVEICLLAGIAGILAWRFPGPGLLLFALVFLLDAPRARLFSRPLAYVVILPFCFLCALGYTALREPAAPPMPQWLQNASSISTGGSVGPVLARVESCTPLPGKRLRLILSHIRPEAAAHEGGAEAQIYAGKAVLTWDNYDPLAQSPLPGQELQANLRFASTRGFLNPGTWDSARYWQDRGIWLRAWGQSFGKKESAAASAGNRPSFSWASSPRAFASQYEAAEFRLEEIRLSLLKAFLAALPESSAGASAILPALVFGDRSLLSYAQNDLFARSTLTHSLSLSGMHLGFMALAGYALARALGALLPGIWLYISRPKLTLLFCLPLTVMYLWLGQAPVSLVRAACMLAFWTLLLFMRKPKVLLDGLFAALAIILLFDPMALFDISLQFSALSVAVVGLCLPGINSLAEALLPRFSNAPAAPAVSGAALWRRRCLREGITLLCLSFCIQLALMPLSVRAFGSAGLLFPLNLIWLPVLGLFVMPLSFLGFFAAALDWQGLAQLFLQAAAVPCEALLALLGFLDRAGWLLSPLMPRPHWASCAGFWLLCITLPGLLLLLRRSGMRNPKDSAERMAGADADKRLAAAWVVLGFVLLLLPPAWALSENRRQGVRLWLLDVGQGQAVLVEWSGLGESRRSGRALIDGGGFASGDFDTGRALIAPALTDNALPRLDMVLNSHPDTDHLSGLLSILEGFTVEHYYSNGGTPTPLLKKREQAVLQKGNLKREIVQAGDKLTLGPDLFLEVLWPPESETSFGMRETGAEKGNNASMVLRLVWQGKALALICGDAEKAALSELVRRSAPDLEARVLVLPHHGSASSLVPDFYDAVKPALALASCGDSSRRRYPAPEIVQALHSRGALIHSTARAGQIRVLWTDPQGVPELRFAFEGAVPHAPFPVSAKKTAEALAR